MCHITIVFCSAGWNMIWLQQITLFESAINKPPFCFTMMALNKHSTTIWMGDECVWLRRPLLNVTEFWCCGKFGPVMQSGSLDERPWTNRDINTLWTGDADLRLYITTVQDDWGKSAFLTRAWFPRTINLITQYMEHFSEWSCWRMFIETRVFGEYFLKISVHKNS